MGSLTVPFLIMALILSGCANTGQIGRSSGSGGAYSQTRPLTVTEAQQALLEKGYDVGPVDGIMGPRTEEAIRKFQKEENLSPTGEVDAATSAALRGGRGSSVDRPTYSSGNSRKPLIQPVGMVNAPGCEGIEVVYFSQTNIIRSDALYFMTIRNNSDIEKTVRIRYRKGTGLTRRKLEGVLGVRIRAKQMERVEIDYGPRPREVEILDCL